MRDRQRRLDEAGDAGRALQVADVRLHRADQQRGVGRPAGTEDRAERGRLDRVADRGAGAVQLDVGDLRRLDAGAVAGLPQQLLLGRPARHGQPVPAAVVVDRPAEHDAQHRVAVGERGGQPLEHDHGAALAADVAVGAGVEGPAAAVRRQRAEAADRLGGLRHQHEVDPAGQGEVDLAAAQLLAGQLHGDQRGALAGVHGEAGPAQAQQVRHPVGQQAALQPGQRVRPGAEPVGQRRVVAVDGADDDRGPAVPQRRRHDPGPLQRLPGQLQGQALLRVHRRRLARRDAEEGGVEAVDGVEEAAAAVVAGIRVRPPVGRHVGHRIAARPEQLPERVRVGRPGQPAGHADDGDGLLGPGAVPRCRHHSPPLSSRKEGGSALRDPAGPAAPGLSSPPRSPPASGRAGRPRPSATAG